jgi:DNA end-binding protein Ku
MAIVEQKRKGHEVHRVQEPDEDEAPPDLMEALRRSLEQVERGRPRPNGSGKQTTSLSKSELEERARELEIPGRSKMSKDELAEAVSSAE